LFSWSQGASAIDSLLFALAARRERRPVAGVWMSGKNDLPKR
jgi:hypothetical protein